MKKMDYCFQGQGHRQGSTCQWMFVHTIMRSELWNLLEPNVVWCCIIMDQSVMWKDLFVIFKVKVTVRVHIIRYVCFYHIYWTAHPFTTKLECFMWKLVCCIQGQGDSKVSNLQWFFVSLYMFCTTALFATKLGVLMYYCLYYL